VNNKKPGETRAFLYLLTPGLTRSYLPQDGYDKNLTSDHQTDQVLKGFIQW